MQVSQGGRPVGRFAPSPTGDLHFGSLVAALGSYLNIRAQDGQWLVRIENIDPPREVPGAGHTQIETLARHGLVSDRPVVWQIDSTAAHQEAVEALIDAGRAYPCACSRADLPPDGRYPGTCRNGLPPGRKARSIRLRCEDEEVHFDDLIQGEYHQNPYRETGDFVIRRADGLYAYQLAVVVDDARAGVTEVVRGADLIDSTGRQILVYRALGLAPPRYAHLPLITDAQGRKLSKSEADDPIHASEPAANLRLALGLLGHPPPEGLERIDSLLSWAIEHWSIERVPRGPVQLGVHPQAA
ncbi:tRNA glutamyl-Q(34) synthetase GluQRS [Wenzhouxiangella marina]|uniref:Glutamyl-Q tRNA(Asp) synthetase n=1 Tax=Wenzhouxiangella marina TaxID=1579979 RepID=A0A0K0XWN2_9GAMM|nr:tRNA glutamyl-Q(34) synthetase GluQRS [Wenzhouxiangella marina]AKS42080.1 Glutamyl-Q tRNA(Asp) synthetase [Wenzhouxiangella marina]MBB6086151.1 glutamyl-Q tRNA(Asp) synthetase [Wenzhouxiangella marina]